MSKSCERSDMKPGFELDGPTCSAQGYGRLVTIGECEKCPLSRYGLFGRRCMHNNMNRPIYCKHDIPSWCPLPCASLIPNYDEDDDEAR